MWRSRNSIREEACKRRLYRLSRPKVAEAESCTTLWRVSDVWRRNVPQAINAGRHTTMSQYANFLFLMVSVFITVIDSE